MGQVRRHYDNSRRAAQAEATSCRIVDVLIAVLGETETEPSVAELAARAGVSTPTVYKAFPNRDELYRAMHRRVTEGLKLRSAANAADLRDVALRLHEFYTESEALIRVVERVPAMKPVRDARLKRRLAALSVALQRELAHLAASEREAVVGVVSLLTGGAGWLVLRDTTRSTPDEICAVRVWALDALITQLRRDAKARMKPREKAGARKSSGVIKATAAKKQPRVRAQPPTYERSHR